MATLKLLDDNFKNMTGYVIGGYHVRNGVGPVPDIVANSPGWRNRMKMRYKRFELNDELVEQIIPKSTVIKPDSNIPLVGVDEGGPISNVDLEYPEYQHMHELDWLTKKEQELLAGSKHNVLNVHDLMNLEFRQIMGVLKCKKDRAQEILEKAIQTVIAQS